MLKVRDLEGFYGRSQALFGMELAVEAGEVVTLMGRNGMGKTTTVHAIMGLLPHRRGVVEFDGQRVDRLPSFRIARPGLGPVPEGRQIFPNLTVRENLLAAAANRSRRADPWTLQRAFEFFPRLAERQRNRGNQLSGGEQQMLAIARALSGKPSVVLMDEPSEGLAPVIVEELARAVKRLAATEGLTMILVEQNTRLALDISPRTAVMDRGRIVYDGPSEALKRDPARLHQLIGVGKS